MLGDADGVGVGKAVAVADGDALGDFCAVGAAPHAAHTRRKTIEPKRSQLGGRGRPEFAIQL